MVSVLMGKRVFKILEILNKLVESLSDVIGVTIRVKVVPYKEIDEAERLAKTYIPRVGYSEGAIVTLVDSDFVNKLIETLDMLCDMWNKLPEHWRGLWSLRLVATLLFWYLQRYLLVYPPDISCALNKFAHAISRLVREIGPEPTEPLAEQVARVLGASLYNIFSYYHKLEDENARVLEAFIAEHIKINEAEKIVKSICECDTNIIVHYAEELLKKLQSEKPDLLRMVYETKLFMAEETVNIMKPMMRYIEKIASRETCRLLEQALKELENAIVRHRE